MDYEEKYKDLVKRLNKAREEKGVYTFNSVLDVVAPELKIDESEDERIRQLLIRFVTYDMSDNYSDDFTPADCVAWLKKQGKNNMGISEATKQKLEDNLNKALEKETPESWNEFLEKQGEPAKLSEEEQNKFAKGVLTSCALSFINYLDAHKYKGKMCVSNGECEDIENAFHNAMWDRLHRYYCKYIEKQGEQKPQGKSALEAAKEEKVDNQNCVKPAKVEPKFKVGDWVIDVQGVSSNQIIGYEDDSYYIETSCSKFYLPMKLAEKNYRLWIIQDAKDGDVLTTDTWTFIFKKYQDKSVYYHCAASAFNDFSISDTGEFDSSYVHPATKEQRYILFQKMKEAGYEWDAEKKELMKIEQKPAWSEEDENRMNNLCHFLEEYGNQYYGHLTLQDTISWLKNRVQPQLKQEWNEEDKSWFEEMELMCLNFSNDTVYREKFSTWLRTLKDRVQPKQEWNKEDKKHFDNIIQELKNQCDRPINASYKEIIVSDIDWLKSIKDRVQSKQRWSEEDSRICKAIIDNIQAICEEGYFVGNISSDKLVEWLKFLKDRVQSKKEWNEEDDKYIISALRMIGHCGFDAIGGLSKSAVIDWLKSLRPQPKQKWSQDDNDFADDAIACVTRCYENYIDNKEFYQSLRHNTMDIKRWLIDVRKRLTPHWKPSDLQIEALESATANCAYSEYEDCLKDLIKQLKQL